MLLLESLLRDAEQIYSLLTGDQVQARPLSALTGASIPATIPANNLPLLAPSAPPSDCDLDEDIDEALARQTLEGEADGLTEWIENPLAILAHVAKAKGRKAEATTDEQGFAVFRPYEAENVTPAEQYFSTGLYEIRLDIAPELDPVTLGLVSLHDFEDLVGL